MADRPTSAPIWRRPDVYAGLLFIAVAALGLVISSSYPMGTAVRMGTGYVPRLLCWTLLALGFVILIGGVSRAASEDELLGAKDWPVMRPLALVTLATIVFALTVESLGLIISLLATILVGSLATRSLRWYETAIAMVVLTAACWAIFSYGLSLPFPVWPRF